MIGDGRLTGRATAPPLLDKEDHAMSPELPMFLMQCAALLLLAGAFCIRGAGD